MWNYPEKLTCHLHEAILCAACGHWLTEGSCCGPPSSSCCCCCCCWAERLAHCPPPLPVPWQLRMAQGRRACLPGNSSSSPATLDSQ
ncbi:brain serine/threonine kinase 2, isoform CRA_c [Rattus norvegicus]|uniref:Brain serine/threonine kinase 2, isoform CRA_c n=1 Tax=Rattus norvegicus TaxID=10116 RepID=A6HY32_RAT|nr:brain serine/threonine kinase 2, isoform CRA_c [Rattus norvegicus]